MMTMKFKRIQFKGNWYQLAINNNPNIIHVAYDINGEFHEDSLSISEFILNDIEQTLRFEMGLPFTQLCDWCTVDDTFYCTNGHHPLSSFCATRKMSLL